MDAACCRERDALDLKTMLHDNILVSTIRYPEEYRPLYETIVFDLVHASRMETILYSSAAKASNGHRLAVSRYRKGERMKKMKDMPVLVTTLHRGVFFGYTDDFDGATVTLRLARNCLYWTTKENGFLGLASAGPSSGCRIGPRVVSLTLRDITSVSLVSEIAVTAWEAVP